MPSKISRVLVTGGGGFIGSHIADALIENGYSVGVLDSFITGERTNLSSHPDSRDSFKLHEVDLASVDYSTIKNIVKEYDAVIHEAALVSVSRSVENPISTNLTNVGATVTLLKAAVDSNVERFLYASSSSVYGDTEILPKKETMPTSPISPYGVSKLAAENYCRVFARVYGLKTVSLRYFNVYGPRQKFGPYSGVIPAFIRNVLNNAPPVINGDGLQTRDFTYVDDVVQANLLALESSVAPGEVFNIAAGGTITINELAENIIRIIGIPNLQPKHVAPRNGDVRASYADIQKASEQLGFKPKFTLATGLRRVIDWFAKNP